MLGLRRHANSKLVLPYWLVKHHLRRHSHSKPVLPSWLVEHKLVAHVLPAIGNGSYASLACGFLMTDIFALRVLLVGGYSGLVVFHALQPQPLRIPLRWSLFFVSINALMVAKLIDESMPVELTAEEEALHVASFAPLSRKQFKRLLDAGECMTFADEVLLTEEGVARPELIFILRGKADMTVNGKHTSTLSAGAFPNSLAFQRAGWRDDTVRTASHRDLFWPQAYGTVRCQGEVEAIVWSKDKLFALLDAQPEMRQSMDHVIVEAIMRRLLSNPDGANIKDYLRVISQSWAAQEVRKRKIRTMETARVGRIGGEGSERMTPSK